MTTTIRRPFEREGFALMAVLWVLVSVASLVAVVSLETGQAMGSASNRLASARARWIADGCAERVHSAIEELLQTSSSDEAAKGIWARIDQAEPAVQGCTVSLRATGAQLNINAATEQQLHRFLAAYGLLAPEADSLTDALLDWRDNDNVTRASGAERAWYEATQADYMPRNDLLASVDELHRVRGFDRLTKETAPGIWSDLTVEDARIDLSHASEAVLSSLPGFTGETVTRVVMARVAGRLPADILGLALLLSPPSRDSLTSHYSELLALCTMDPDGWILTAEASAGVPSVTAITELRFSRAGRRAAVIRRREWLR